MRICFVATASSAHSYRWVKYFAVKGHEVHWISFVPSKFKPIGNVTFYKLKNYFPKWMSVFYFSYKVRSLVKQIKPDILHSHYVGTYGLAGALSGFSPFVLTAWGSDVLISTKKIIKKILIKYSLDQADIIMCDGENVRCSMISLGVKQDKIRLIKFGIDTKKFKIIDASGLKRKIFNNNDPIVLSVRNLYKIYDLQTLIMAIPEVLKKISNVRFLIIGDGPQKINLISLTKSLNIFGSVMFIGNVQNEDMPLYMNAADVYVSTSLSDGGLPASTAEAMACALPIISTPSGDTDLWIKNNHNGIIIPFKNCVILAENIVRLLSDVSLKTKLIAENRKAIYENYNYDKELEKAHSIYENILVTKNKCLQRKVR